MQLYQGLLAIFLISFHFPGMAQETSSPLNLNGESDLLKPEGGWPRDQFSNSVTNSTVSDSFGESGKEKVTILDEVSVSETSPTKKSAGPVEEKPLAGKTLDSDIPKPDIHVLLNPNDEVEPFIATREKKFVSARKRPRTLYTLGPGDLVTFATYDRTDLKRSVRIAPDGTVSYLQAVAVNARGLTVDQLRNRVQEELRKYKRDIKIIVTPQDLQSKEFAVIGRVKKPGSFTLDRPTTILEGIALAEGVEIGTIRGSAYGLADFGRSFVSGGRLYSPGPFTKADRKRPDRADRSREPTIQLSHEDPYHRPGHRHNHPPRGRCRCPGAADPARRAPAARW